MAKLFSLAWRYLLVAALVFNPVAGAAASVATPTAKAPSCQDMAMHHDAAAPADDASSDRSHGCGCGNTVCQFACCAAIAFAVPVPPFAPLAHAEAAAAPDSSGTAPPPRSRMIRPPIA